MAVPLSRIQALTKLRCSIYNHTYNPTNTRTGAKVLRQRLRGPALAAYYPRRVVTIKDLDRLYPDLETFDEKESDRLEDEAIRKGRGKGPPKKKRTAEESKKFSSKKKKTTAAPAGAPAPAS